jgi:hypothetical protein
MATKYLKRVVKGPKAFHHLDPKTGKRFIAQPGEEIFVLAQQAKSKAKHLIDPKVAAAMKAAEEAAEIANATEVLEAAATKEAEDAQARSTP